jgi:hypothetical protein
MKRFPFFKKKEVEEFDSEKIIASLHKTNEKLILFYICLRLIQGVIIFIFILLLFLFGFNLWIAFSMLSLSLLCYKITESTKSKIRCNYFTIWGIELIYKKKVVIEQSN